MRYSTEEKAMWLEQWRNSGKSAWAYAKENGLCQQTFFNWTKQQSESKVCFVEVPAQILPPSQYNGEMVIEKSGVKIHLPLSCGYGELRAIFNALGDAL